MGASIVETFTTAFTGITSGLSSGIVDTFNTIVTNSEGGLSNLATWGLVFGGVALGIGILKGFMRKVG
jgi:hypothetical protein